MKHIDAEKSKYGEEREAQHKKSKKQDTQEDVRRLAGSQAARGGVGPRQKTDSATKNHKEAQNTARQCRKNGEKTK